MNQVAGGFGGDRTVAEEVIDAGIHGDHAVEHARLRVDIELHEDFRFGLRRGGLIHWRLLNNATRARSHVATRAGSIEYSSDHRSARLAVDQTECETSPVSNKLAGERVRDRFAFADHF